MTAIELANRQEIYCCHKETDPAGKGNRMQNDILAWWYYPYNQPVEIMKQD